MSSLLKPNLQASYICTGCFKPRRRLFTTSRIQQSTAPRKEIHLASRVAHLTDRTIISLTGNDASKFLQGLTTNNVDPGRDVGWYSAFLNAPGRVLMDSIIYPIKDTTNGGERGYLIEVDKSISVDLMKHLKRHKLRSKIQLRDAGEEWEVWSAWSPGDSEKAAEYKTASTTETAITLPDPRHHSLGSRMLISTSMSLGSHESSSRLKEKTGDSALELYSLNRYLNGIPEGPLEIIPQTALPLESNIDYLNGVDFRKGCYVGQELTIRTQHTGVVRKRILPVQLYTAATGSPGSGSHPTPMDDINNPEAAEFHLAKQVPAGTEIKAKGGKRPSGRFLAGIGNVGLALCRVENMTDLRVSAEGGTYKEDLEFNLGDTGIKIKAFVPEWMRLAEEKKREGRKVTAAGED